MRDHKESPQKTVSQKGFALFGELKPLVPFSDYPPNKANPFERLFFEVTLKLVVSRKRDYCSPM